MEIGELVEPVRKVRELMHMPYILMFPPGSTVPHKFCNELHCEDSIQEACHSCDEAV